MYRFITLVIAFMIGFSFLPNQSYGGNEELSNPTIIRQNRTLKQIKKTNENSDMTVELPPATSPHSEQILAPDGKKFLELNPCSNYQVLQGVPLNPNHLVDTAPDLVNCPVAIYNTSQHVNITTYFDDPITEQVIIAPGSVTIKAVPVVENKKNIETLEMSCAGKDYIMVDMNPLNGKIERYRISTLGPDHIYVQGFMCSNIKVDGTCPDEIQTLLSTALLKQCIP